MGKYLLKRCLMIVPMLLGISFILFIVMHVAPGDPASIRYGLNPEISGEARDDFNRMFDLDKPVLEQYVLWMKRFVLFDFGGSLIDGRPVKEKIAERIPATLLLQFTSLVIIFLIAVPVGVISAVRKGGGFDRTATLLMFIGYAMPTFWLALILILFFGVDLRWFPISGMTPWYAEYLGGAARLRDLVWHMVLPVTATAFGSLASLSRYTRASVIEVMREPYILAARAKGLSENRVIFVHALRNALLPVITVMGLTLPALVSGSFIFESIFAWPGMGRLGYEAIMNYDYPVIMGVGVLSTFLTLVGIFLADILYAVADPRIRFGRRD
ncbi:MAG: ABC transporter permease [Candidatus Omnitrophica bacterium]|nr:ABC transporter permease [Candidatus Omnitrophota bacterium]MDD5488125.1 ABC transporter permease [Candidatus Omnitrophota bacterium]